jgi:hypothetical protein
MDGAVPTTTELTLSNDRPLDALIAGIDATVHSMRSSTVSGREFRRLARERRVDARVAYEPIRAAGRIRYS